MGGSDGGGVMRGEGVMGEVCWGGSDGEKLIVYWKDGGGGNGKITSGRVESITQIR